jgi:hypothetical protein
LPLLYKKAWVAAISTGLSYPPSPSGGTPQVHRTRLASRIMLNPQDKQLSFGVGLEGDSHVENAQVVGFSISWKRHFARSADRKYKIGTLPSVLFTTVAIRKAARGRERSSIDRGLSCNRNPHCERATLNCVSQDLSLFARCLWPKLWGSLVNLNILIRRMIGLF